jgi:hypothetical protein
MKKATVSFEDFAGKGVDLEAVMKSAEAFSRGFQALASETAEYSQRALGEGVSAFEKFSGARSYEAVMAAQSDYAKAAYEGYVGQLTKVGEIFGQMAREAGAPYGLGTFGK